MARKYEFVPKLIDWRNLEESVNYPMPSDEAIAVGDAVLRKRAAARAAEYHDLQIRQLQQTLSQDDQKFQIEKKNVLLDGQIKEKQFQAEAFKFDRLAEDAANHHNAISYVNSFAGSAEGMKLRENNILMERAIAKGDIVEALLIHDDMSSRWTAQASKFVSTRRALETPDGRGGFVSDPSLPEQIRSPIEWMKTMNEAVAPIELKYGQTETVRRTEYDPSQADPEDLVSTGGAPRQNTTTTLRQQKKLGFSDFVSAIHQGDRDAIRELFDRTTDDNKERVASVVAKMVGGEEAFQKLSIPGKFKGGYDDAQVKSELSSMRDELAAIGMPKEVGRPEEGSLKTIGKLTKDDQFQLSVDLSSLEEYRRGSATPGSSYSFVSPAGSSRPKISQDIEVFADAITKLPTDSIESFQKAAAELGTNVAEFGKTIKDPELQKQFDLIANPLADAIERAPRIAADVNKRVPVAETMLRPQKSPAVIFNPYEKELQHQIDLGIRGLSSDTGNLFFNQRLEEVRSLMGTLRSSVEGGTRLTETEFYKLFPQLRK